MNRKLYLALMLLSTLMLLSGCATERMSPLTHNEATSVPGLSMNLHAASAGDDNTDQVQATLFFQYLDEPMLAAESKVLTVRRDESVELAIIRALVEGPGASRSDLRRLLPADTTVESVTSREDILFVTFDGGFLQDDVPENWQELENWQTKAPIKRQLTAQSIAASITELFPYTGIQILIHRTDVMQTNLRLENSYFLTGKDGLSDPIARNEDFILTPHNTAKQLLTAWQEHDFERLYRYVIEIEKPAYATMAETLASVGTLVQYTMTAGNVSADGHHATLAISLRTLKGGITLDTPVYPLQLSRENGIWKISYTHLLALMGR